MTKIDDLTMPELLKRLDSGEIPLTAKVRVTFDDSTVAPRSIDPSISLFQQWMDEDAHSSEQSRAENDKIYAEIEARGIPRLAL